MISYKYSLLALFVISVIIYDVFREKLIYVDQIFDRQDYRYMKVDGRVVVEPTIIDVENQGVRLLD